MNTETSHETISINEKLKKQKISENRKKNGIAHNSLKQIIKTKLILFIQSNIDVIS